MLAARLLSFLVCSFLWSISVLAEEPFSFEKTPGKLPKTVIPLHYELWINPDVEAMAFSGEVSIDINILQAVTEVVLNSHNLKVTTARIRSSDPSSVPITTRQPSKQSVVPLHRETPWEGMSVFLDSTNQLLSLKSSTLVKPGNYQLRLEFSGRISESPVGLFLIKYKAPSGSKKMLATQFEATDARQVFPCFDEPVFRATFSLSVEVPFGETPVSNMPVARSIPAGQARKKVSFERTPSMPTYLLVLVVGELEQISSRAGRIETRVWFTEGKREKAAYALNNSKRLLAYFENYFGVDYPLPKLDHIALPGGFGGAMEHWGAITYNESTILFDPKVSSQNVKERSFGIMAHEMAHQWFGNLVTMAWWDNLWLNEGFASWMGAKATDALNPDWFHWMRVDGGKVGLMALDAQKSTHPIQRPVLSEAQIGDAFDGITYQKGMFFIRMLEDYLGEHDFQKGLQRYMRTHAFGNTTTADLWADLAAVSQRPVAQFAAGWTEQPGLPIVIATSECVNGRQELKLHQERFSLLDPKAAPLRWQIPISIATVNRKKSQIRTLLEDAPITLKLQHCDEPIKLNAGSRGYYRVAYDRSLFDRLRRSFNNLDQGDQVNFLSDAWAMVETDRLPVADYLEIIPELLNGTSVAVWDQVLGSIGGMDHLLDENPIQREFRRRIRVMLFPVLLKHGFRSKAGETSNQGLLRAQLINLLGAVEQPEVLEEAKRRFEDYLKNPSHLTGNLRPILLRIVGHHASTKEYNDLIRLARAAALEEDRGVLLASLAGAKNAELATRTLNLSLTKEFPPTQSARLVSMVSATGTHAQLAWDFMKKHHRELLALTGGPFMNKYAGTTVAGFSDDSHASEYVEFTKTNYPADSLPKAEEAADQIRYKSYMKRLITHSLETWVKKHR